MGFNHIPVILQVAYAVAHGMCIFALNQRFASVFVGVANHAFNTGVHGGENVGVSPSVSLFVLYGPTVVGGFKVVVGGIKIDSVACFVAQRPNDDGRLVFVPLVHVAYPEYMGCLPSGIFCQGAFAITHSVGFDIGLINYVKAVTVAQLVKPFGLRIVGGADCVEVVHFHNADVLQHGGLVHYVTSHLMMLVQVGSFQVDVFSVNQ